MRKRVLAIQIAAIFFTLAPANAWAESDVGADKKCRYDFARRRMVCEPVVPPKPVATQPSPAPIPAPVQSAEPSNNESDMRASDRADGQIQRDTGVAEPSPPNSVELRVVGLPPHRQLPVREGPSIRDYLIGRIPSDARNLRLLDCPKRKWCEVEHYGLRGFVARRNVEPVNPDIPWARKSTARFKVARVPWNDTLNVRRGPSMETPIVGRIPSNARGITLRGRCRYEWCPIKYGRVRGWAGSFYLAREN